ncbi:MAG: ATPase, partial [Thermoplasmata archaeon]
AKIAILKVHTKNMPLANDVDLESLAKRLEGYVGSDIEGLVREAAMNALRENPNATTVALKHFEQAMEHIKPSADEETIKYFKNITRDFEGGISKKKKEELGIYR